MITLYGVTEQGTSVPVQVTAEGKIVAIGQPGESGPVGPVGPQGPKGDQGEYGPGDDVDLGSARFAESVQSPSINVINEITTSGTSYFSCNDKVGGYSSKIIFYSGGAATFAQNKCGFTKEGELYFTSRGTRYKLEVAGGLCNAIEYTREMQLRERVEDKRKPRPTDSVPED